MPIAQHCLTHLRSCITPLFRRRISSQRTFKELGIPLKPTWSVNELLSSYPKPEISDTTLEQLHKLSALKPPARDTNEYKDLKRDMEEIIRLVEAVKLVCTDGVQIADASYDHMLGRPMMQEVGGPHGRDLLKYARHTNQEYFIVDIDSNQ